MTEEHQKILQIPHTRIDVIGDVHGEIDVLNQLLDQLGYSQDGTHEDGRHLVFVGDLMDRGWNSLAVYEKVSKMVKEGYAHCVLGNHELNLLIPAGKDPRTPKMKGGNNWFHGAIELVDAKDPTSIQPQYLLTDDDKRLEIQQFCASLPIAIEATGIRIVHACWDSVAIESLRHKKESLLDVYQDYEKQYDEWFERERQKDPILQQYKTTKEVKENIKPPKSDGSITMAALNIHPLYIASNDKEQNGNPIKKLTSGPESALSLDIHPYMASKKLRYFKRDRWWENYTEDPLVIIGHYWRRAYPKSTVAYHDLTSEEDRNIPSVFPDELEQSTYHKMLGPRQNVMCVDYAVGKRFLERHHGLEPNSTGAMLGALRCDVHLDERIIDTKLFLSDGRNFPNVKIPLAK